MSEKKNSKTLLGFIKKNLYYLVIGASLVIIATVIAIVLFTGKRTDQGLKPGSEISYESEKPSSTGNKESEKTSDKPSEPEKESEKDPEKESEKPADAKIIFAMPVATSSVIKNYTSSTVVFNKTLGVYTGHMGIDFAAEAGTDVVAVYDGTIESITSSYLQGTTITINHGNGLKTVYNSLEADETLAEGKTVKKGDKIGTVSDNNRQEYKDGPHLHFEVVENGKKIDPETYLLTSQK